MPELPEVETTRCGLSPHLCNATITQTTVRQWQLRQPIIKTLPKLCNNQIVTTIARRGKYLIIGLKQQGHLIVHLGMSGSLRLTTIGDTLKKHDHVIFELNNGYSLRFHDPRRFGLVLWTDADPLQHSLLTRLGPEPLTSEFDAAYLYAHTHHRHCNIKSAIMNSHIVVGVGNIYANEALFLAKIHPQRRANNLSFPRYELLVTMIKKVLTQAIECGGTTLRDFVNGSGEPGYFKQALNVYGRGGQACVTCQSTLREIRLNQRSTVYCPQCQR